MEQITLENRKVIYKNFRGMAKEFNNEGDRNFSVVIDNLDEANDLRKDGWYLRPIKDEEGEITAYHISVSVRYRNRDGKPVLFPPRVYKLRDRPQTPLLLNEDTIGMLDYLRIEYADVTLNPYEWAVQGNTGVKAYCQTMYVAVILDRLDEKYAGYNEEDEEDPF